MVTRRVLAGAVVMGMAGAAFGQSGLPAWIEPPEGSVRFGSSVASGADVDGDGVNDFFVSDPGIETKLGLVGAGYLYSGATLDLLWSGVGRDIVETNGQSWQYDMPAAFIDDIDGDELPDLAIGRRTALESRGSVEIRRGRTGALLYRFAGLESGDFLGIDVARLGDLDGDHVDEFCCIRWGFVDIRSGTTGQIIDSIPVENPRRARNAGDVDGDLIDDIVVGRWYGGLSNGLSMYSGATRQLIWNIGRPSGATNFGYNLAAGHDLDGDDIPDVLVTGVHSIDTRVYVVSGATGDATVVRVSANLLSWVALGDVTGDGRVEPILGTFGANEATRWFNIYDHEPGSVPFGLPVYSVDWQVLSGIVFGTELSVEDITGDGCADLILGSNNNMGVRLIAGSPMLVGHDLDTYAAFGERDVPRGTLAKFSVVGDAPGRTVRLAASRRGHGCTFIPQLGICIDLDRPFQQIGQAVTDADGFARFSLTIPPSTPLGPAWLQCLDVNFPGRGPATSNVMKIHIVE